MSLLISTMAVFPSAIGAQGKPEISIIPRFGLMSPDSYFYEEFENFADDEPAEWTTGSLGRAAVLGLALEASFGDRGIAIRGEIARTVSGWLSTVHGFIRPRVFFEPPEIVNTWLDVPASITFANVQAVLPTRFKPWGIQPFALVGGGGNNFPSIGNITNIVFKAGDPGFKIEPSFIARYILMIFNKKMRIGH